MFYWDEDAQRMKDMHSHIIAIHNKMNKMENVEKSDLAAIKLLIDNPTWFSDLYSIVLKLASLHEKVDSIEKKLKIKIKVKKENKQKKEKKNNFVV